MKITKKITGRNNVRFLVTLSLLFKSSFFKKPTVSENASKEELEIEPETMAMVLLSYFERKYSAIVAESNCTPVNKILATNPSISFLLVVYK